MADDEGGGRRDEYGGEKRRERISRESERDGDRNRERERDKGKDRRHRDVDVNRERDRGARDRDRDMDRDRHRGHDRERRSREYGGDRDRRHRHRSRSTSRGRSREVSRSGSRSRSRSRKLSGFDKAAPSAVVGSSTAVPGIRFQAACNGIISGELQSTKVSVDGADSQQSEAHDGEVQGNKSAAVAVAKTGKSSKWGPAPSSDEPMSSEVANDFQAAKMAALRAAELVNKNMSLAGFMTADHKKKLLWGSKKTEVEQEPVVAAAGTNRWDTVHFSDRDRMEKFHKLMGVKGDIKEGEAPPPPPGAGVFTEEKQRELQADLEKQFTQGLRRRDGRTVGLGL